MNEMNTIISMLSDLIPDGTKKEVKIDGVTYKFNKDNGEIKIEVVEPFDDSEVKELVNNYKEKIKALDDNIFIEATEDFSSEISLKEFNELLDLEDFTEEQANRVQELIDISTKTIRLHLQHKIQSLIEFYDNF